MAVRVTPGPERARRWPAALAWSLWALAVVVVLPMVAWLDHLLRAVGRPDLVEFTPTAIPPVLGGVSATTVGAVLASRRPRHRAGWLLLALGVCVSASGPAEAGANYGAAVGATPTAVGLVTAAAPATVVGAIACLGFVLLLTPTGSLPSARWRWWAWLAAGLALALVALVAAAPAGAGRPLEAIDSPMDLHAFAGVRLVAVQAALAWTNLCFLVAAVSLVLRFRRASGGERQQLRWVALATAVLALLAVVVVAALALRAFALAALVGSLCVAILPLAIGAAILRYRLYDLDRIVSRTVAYALLTLLLGGGYAAAVLGLGQLPGRRSNLVVAAATLAVAAAFQPARRRIQHAVDRRFNRRRYDAARTVQAFGARLRREVDLDALTGELLSVVEQTMQPTTVSLSLRPSGPAVTRARGASGAPG